MHRAHSGATSPAGSSPVPACSAAPLPCPAAPITHHHTSTGSRLQAGRAQRGTVVALAATLALMGMGTVWATLFLTASRSAGCAGAPGGCDDAPPTLTVAPRGLHVASSVHLVPPSADDAAPPPRQIAFLRRAAPVLRDIDENAVNAHRDALPPMPPPPPPSTLMVAAAQEALESELAERQREVAAMMRALDGGRGTASGGAAFVPPQEAVDTNPPQYNLQQMFGLPPPGVSPRPLPSSVLADEQREAVKAALAAGQWDGVPFAPMPQSEAVAAARTAIAEAARGRLDELTPMPGMHLLSHIARHAGDAPPPVGDAARQLPPDTTPYPAATTYYSMPPGGRYRCRALGQLSFNLFPTIAPATGDIVYGEWAMKYPRFISLAHALWWDGFALVNDRRGRGCPRSQPHPLAKRIQAYDLAHAEVLASGSPKAAPSHSGWMGYCEPAFRAGHIDTATGARLAVGTDTCGQEGNIAAALAAGAIMPAAVRVPHAVWNVIPAVPFFQHFVQNSLPKFAAISLVQPHLFPRSLPPTPGAAGAVNDSARYPIVAVQELLLDRFPIINAFYDRLGWLPPVDIRSESVQGDSTVYPCNTPPLHPLLWQLASSVVLRLPPPKPLEERHKLVYCGRSRGGKIENAARRVLNEDHVLRLLRAWAPEGGAPGDVNGDGTTAAPLELVEFDHAAYDTIDKLVAFWSDVRGLVGPHGGCLTNVVFMPCNSLVVELMPLLYGRKPAGVPHHASMMYTQATFLEHEYWMLPSTTTSTKGDFVADLDGLCRILFESLGPPRSAPAYLRDDCATLLPILIS